MYSGYWESTIDNLPIGLNKKLVYIIFPSFLFLYVVFLNL